MIPIAITRDRSQVLDDRAATAQWLGLCSLQRAGCLVRIFDCDERPLFRDVLDHARKASGDWFGYVNSDCQLLAPPRMMIYETLDVLGMRRVDVGPGTICGGVDGYLIRTAFWDEVLSKDAPDLYVGATHVDWWLSRAAQRFGRYAEMVCLAHLPHERTASSRGVDECGRHNVAAFEAWAKRHGVDAT
jgi:hypothetical protein